MWINLMDFYRWIDIPSNPMNMESISKKHLYENLWNGLHKFNFIERKKDHFKEHPSMFPTLDICSTVHPIVIADR
jgi:hypothetical protein